MMSPIKKKMKINNAESNKRVSDTNEPSDSPRKRILGKDVEMQAKKRKNFITACEQVSCRDYFDYRSRLLLVYLPACMKTVCSHHDKSGILKPEQMPLNARESFDIDMKNNMWYEALEVCHMHITARQYLSSDVLKDIVEIIMNAHEDEYSQHTVKNLINKCQQILMHHFSTHTPCIVKSVRNCYNSFLTSPMVLKENTFTNRSKYECHKGIVKYCLNRLEHEISIDSEDGPLIDKDKSIPEEMKNSVRGFHWQKEKCEIFELLNRPSRIERLFAVLESVIELLQFDLAIWHSRYTNDLGRHIMRSHRPLMARVLWSENVLYTGAVTNICRQILRIFTKIIHLSYPDAMVRIITIWLNTMVQTFYICESNSNVDYPNTSKYCNIFANDFYKIVSDMPPASIIRILERIEPPFMRHLIGLLHIKKILSTDESCIIEILINFLRRSHWKSYKCYSVEQKLSDKLFPKAKKTKKKIGYLLKKYINGAYKENTHIETYEKMNMDNERTKDICLNHIVMSLYITLEAYLDAYDIQSVQETWNDLNIQTMNNNTNDNDSITCVHNFYSVTESLIKTYRNILQSTRELMGLFNDLIKKNELPEAFNIFENIGLVALEK